MLERLAYIAACCVLGFAVGWTVQGWRTGARLAAQAAAYSKRDAVAATASAKQIRDAADRNAAMARDLATVDRNRERERNAKQAEVTRLNDCVRAGGCGLRVAAVCPSGPGVLPSAAPGSRVDTDAAPRLTADAEQAYFALRTAINGQREQLAACVDSLGRITGQ